MKFEEKIGEIPGKTRKKKANVNRKKQPPATRRFYHKLTDKNTSKNDSNILKNRKDLFTEITDSEFLQPLRQKQKPKQKAGKPKLSLNTYTKGLEQESKSFSSEKDKQKGELQSYGFTTETGLPGDNNAVESVNNLFRHFLEPNTKPQMKEKWKRKHFMRKGFLLPQNKSLDENGEEEVNDENARPNLQYNVSVLQNEVGDFLNPVVDFRKYPNQTLDSLKDVIPAATGDEKHKDIDTEMVEIGGDDETQELESDTESEPETETATKPETENPYVFEDDILTEMAMGILLSLFPKDSETSPGAPGAPGTPVTNITNITNNTTNVTNNSSIVPVTPVPTPGPLPGPAPKLDEDIALQIAMGLMDTENIPHPPGPAPKLDEDIALQIAMGLMDTENNPQPPGPAPKLDEDIALQIALALSDTENNPQPPGPAPKLDEDIALQIALALSDTENNPQPPGPVPVPKPAPKSDEDIALQIALALSDTENIPQPPTPKPEPTPKIIPDNSLEIALGIIDLERKIPDPIPKPIIPNLPETESESEDEEDEEGFEHDDITPLAISIAGLLTNTDTKKYKDNFNRTLRKVKNRLINPKDDLNIKEVPINLTEIDYSAKEIPTLHKFVIKDEYKLMNNNLDKFEDKYSKLSNKNIEIKNL